MAYVSGREAVLVDRIERNDAPPSVKDLLENYRNHLRTARARMSASKGSSHTAFATLQGAPQEDPENKQGPCQEKNSTLKKLSDCLCGESHRFKDCAYFIEELRGAEWAPNEEVKRQIDDKLSKIPRLRIAVEKAQKQARDSKEKEKAPTTVKKSALAGAFAVECFSYKLKNCWTLDSGTDIHVNDRTRFQIRRMATEEDVLIAGKTTYAVEAFGSVEITANAPNGPVTIELLNVALAPGFLTNLVCLRRFTDKGVH
jgi:hypothetical protein